MMRKIKTLYKLLKNNPDKLKETIALKLCYLKILHIIPDKPYLSLIYRLYFNKKINFEHPSTFNEKLQWLKINNRKNEYIEMVDKFEAKSYVKERLGEEYIIKTYGIWNNFDEINFDSLPQSFVLKCTHDSGSVVIVRDKDNFDINSARKILMKGLKNNLFYYGREWPYKYVKPRIIAEELLLDAKNSSISDYKFFCFNGKVKCFKVDFDRFTSHKANYYDKNCNLLPFGEMACPPDFNKKLQIPKNINEMIDLSEILSKGQPFLRVDFYSVNKKIYFGEMTFYPATGFGAFTDEKWDYRLGEWIELKKE